MLKTPRTAQHTLLATHTTHNTTRITSLPYAILCILMHPNND